MTSTRTPPDRRSGPLLFTKPIVAALVVLVIAVLGGATVSRQHGVGGGDEADGYIGDEPVRQLP